MLYVWIIAGYQANRNKEKLRWEDDVIQDTKTPGVKNCRNLAMEKESWQKLLRKARAHVGLSSQ
jgi:hypothetical protein